MSRNRWILLAAALCASSCLLHARAAVAGGCDAYTWNVQQELAVMGKPSEAIRANENVKQAAMPLQLDQHYLLTLQPQNTVGFVVPPTRASRDASPWGGIAYFHVRESGRYRIGLNTGHWIDLIDAGNSPIDPAAARVIPSVAHEGQSGCARLHKLVAFELEGGKTYRLHFSGREAEQVHVLVTREPVRSDEAK